MRKNTLIEFGLLGLAIICALGVVGAYVRAFGSWPWGEPEDWSKFGDYFGGVLNPLIGVLTVILIVLTLRTTRKEASDTRFQMEQQVDLLKTGQILDDMQKRLDGVLAEWNREMEQMSRLAVESVRDTSGRLMRGHPQPTVRDVLEDRQIHYNLVKASKVHDEVAAQARYVAPKWKESFAHLLPLLSELDKYCREYEQLTGSFRLTNYYKARVSTAVRSLGAAGIMADSTYERFTDPR